MIVNFQNKGLKRFFETGNTSGIDAKHAKRIARILALLNTATTVEDVDLPGLRLHELKGNRKGTWTVTVNGNWRMTFKFQNGDAYDVDYEDYH